MTLPVEAMEGALLAEEQVEIPVTHHFGPGIYIREISVPAGTLIIGHHHKGPCLNELLKGSMRIIGADGEAKTIEAPFMFTSPAGRKVGYALTDVIFRNLHATDETDLEKLEEHLIDKSKTWLAHEEAKRLIEGA